MLITDPFRSFGHYNLPLGRFSVPIGFFFCFFSAEDYAIAAMSPSVVGAPYYFMVLANGKSDWLFYFISAEADSMVAIPIMVNLIIFLRTVLLILQCRGCLHCNNTY